MNETAWQTLETRSAREEVILRDGQVARAGSSVRLKPQPGRDIFDLALADRIGLVQSIEEDFEGRFYVAITLADDPGQDLGAQRLIGHRFFFAPNELELAS